MKISTLVLEIQEGRTLKLPADICDRLRIETGDRVEVTIKKIKSGRLDLIMSENPLNQLLALSKSAGKKEDE